MGMLQVEKWFGSKKELASVRSCCSHIKNMQIGTLPIEEKKSLLIFVDNLSRCILKRDSFIALTQYK